MHQKSLLSLTAALGVFAGPLQAFSLGDIDVHSALNQPFEADIMLRSVRSDERDNLQVRLASDAEFERAGLARPFSLTSLQFNIVESGNNVVVRVSSETPIKEPFLDFIVSATAGEGRMLREYTVLLDPPRAATQRQSATTPQTVQRQPSAERSGSTDSPTSYRVRSNDTLWRVAESVRPDGDISVYQMMMALFEQNPQAFLDNNINNLRSDVTLNVPDRAVISSLTATEARQSFYRQTQQWQQSQAASAEQENTSSDSDTSSETPVEETSEATTETTATDTAAEARSNEALPAEETLTERDETGQIDNAVIADSRLDLLAPNQELENPGDEISTQGDPSLQQMSEQLTFAQETIEAQNQQNTDLKARMDNMEEQIETMRRLLSLKEADMARLQSLLAENDGDIDDLAAALQAQENTGTTESSETDSSTASGNDDANQQTDADTQTADRSDNTAENPGQRLSAILSDYSIPLGLGILLILLLGLLLIRRRQSLREEDVLVSSDTDVSDYFEAGGSEGEMIPPEVTELEEAPVVEETKTTAELIEQADMFAGYADYTQALHTLEQARLQSPNDQQVIYKRLFVLYKLQRTNEFVEQLADAEFGIDSDEWQQITSWGRELDPNHPLFREASPSEGESSEPLEDNPIQQNRTAETQTQTTETVSAEYLDAFDSRPDEETPADEPDLEFILDEPPASQTDEDSDDSPKASASDSERPDSSDSLQFTETSDPTADIEPVSLDISDVETDDDSDTEAEDLSTPTSTEDDALSLDFSDDEQSHLSSDAPGVAPAPDKDDNDDDLTLDLSDYDDFDEIETKLDLAAAYVDMEDHEAARGILQEVLSEGDEPQQKRARTLLNTLS